MLNGLFDEDPNLDEESIMLQYIESINQNLENTKTCADEIEMPKLKRKNFIGLKNQGATCYLNSFFQILYFMPEIRNLFLNANIQKMKQQKNNFWKVIQGLQQLMLNMKYLDDQNQTTIFLNEAFGWNGSEMLNQHDIQEAMRVILDYVENSFLNSEEYDEFKNLLKGFNDHFVMCLNCEKKFLKKDAFYEVFINIKEFGKDFSETLEQAMENAFSPEKLEGDNKYFCENCDCKHDALKGTTISSLPVYTCFYINRFDFNYETFQRIKLKEKFSFPLSLNMNKFMTDKGEDKDFVYELNGIIVHRGTPYSGHYFLVARDLLNEGDNEKSSFYELNDTIVRKVDDDHYEKFFGNKDETGYLLFYRRKNFELKNNFVLDKENLIYKGILEENEKIEKMRTNYEELKNCVKIKILKLENLLSLDVIDKNNLQLSLVKEIDKNIFEEFIMKKNNMISFISEFENKFNVDLDNIEIYQIHFLIDNLVYYKRKIDFRDYLKIEKEEDFDINYLSTFIFIEKNSIFKQCEPFLNFQKNNLPLYINIKKDDKMLKMFINQLNTSASFFSEISKEFKTEIDGSKLFINNNNEKMDLLSLQKIKPLNEILNHNCIFEYLENFEKGLLQIVLEIDEESKTFKLDDKCTLNDVFEIIRKNWDLENNEFILETKDEKKYDFELKDDLLVDLSKETVILFKIIKKEIEKKKIELKIIEDDYEETKKIESLFFIGKITKTKDLITFLIEKKNFEEEKMSFFKMNIFEEPVRRIQLKNISIKNLEVDGELKIFVRNSKKKMEFELKKIIIFTPIKYPKDIKKRFDIKIDLSQKIGEMKKVLIDKLIKMGIFKKIEIKSYFFQTFTRFNIPSAYILNDKSKVSKVLNKCDRILIRENKNEKEINPRLTNLYFRKRNTEKKDYEECREIFISPKFKKMTKKNFLDLKKHFMKLLDLEIEEDKVLFLVVDYKNFLWKKLKDLTHFKFNNGDEIGYVLDYNVELKDDFQTDDFLALRLRGDVKEIDYFTGKIYTKEKAFKINPDLNMVNNEDNKDKKVDADAKNTEDKKEDEEINKEIDLSNN